jgi:hypothetical protein
VLLHRDQVLVLNLRNLLLIVLFVWVAWPRAQAQRAPAQNEAMLLKPPSKPAKIPNASSP